MCPQTTKADPVRAVGDLLAGGDWASAHGDFGTLGHVAGLLADRVAEPLCCECREICACCCTDPDAASARWARVRDAMRVVSKGS